MRVFFYVFHGVARLYMTGLNQLQLRPVRNQSGLVFLVQ